VCEWKDGRYTYTALLQKIKLIFKMLVTCVRGDIGKTTNVGTLIAWCLHRFQNLNVACSELAVKIIGKFKNRIYRQ
jgi:hypothetical protein